MRGRGPKPAQTKIIEGNRSKVSIAKIGRDPAGLGFPRMPPGLSDGEEELWLDVVASLPEGLLTSADEGILERYVRAWFRYRGACKKMAETGILIKSPNGPVRNPLLVVVNQAERAMHAAGAEIGLSPVARARLANTDFGESDPIGMLLGDDALWEPPPRKRIKDET